MRSSPPPAPAGGPAEGRLARSEGPLAMPEPFRSFTSKVVPLHAENVDTDQVVPARYLKITDKMGLADVLFRDWRFEEDGSPQNPPFVPAQPGTAGRGLRLGGGR